MRRVNRHLDRALKIFPIKRWTEQFATRQFKLAERFAREENTWTAKTIHWDPLQVQDPYYIHTPYRTRGRPKRKWDDYLRDFTIEEFGENSWIDIARSPIWHGQHDNYRKYIIEEI